MFKKVPYGVKVRVKGNEVTGYRAQLCITCSRILPDFMNIWSDIHAYENGIQTIVFDTLEAARAVAMKEYESWIAYYKQCEEETKQTKKVAKKVVWEHP